LDDGHNAVINNDMTVGIYPIVRWKA